MKTLNLLYPEKSEIKFKHSKFPDGQQQIVISGSYATVDILIKSRLNNWIDLEIIICATKSLRNLGVKNIDLYVPYFLGSRSDRQFEKGSNNYLKDIICPIINLQDYNSVTVLDPHSDILEACLNGFNKISNKKLVKYALERIYGTKQSGDLVYPNTNNCILVSPDAGASKKIYKLAEEVDYKGDIVICSKERDENGKLSRCVVPNFDDDKDVIIIDDIFDYGSTFINIANEIKGKFNKNIYLIVTHSIQTVGLHNALKHFDAIYTTNSIKEHNIPKVFQLNVF